MYLQYPHTLLCTIKYEGRKILWNKFVLCVLPWNMFRVINCIKQISRNKFVLCVTCLSRCFCCVVMERYSKEQCILIAKTHYQNGEHHVVTVRKLRTILGRHNAPNKSTVRRSIKKFEESGFKRDDEFPGRPRSGWSEANVTVVHGPVESKKIVSPLWKCRQQQRKEFWQKIFTYIRLQRAINTGTQISRPPKTTETCWTDPGRGTIERGLRRAHYFQFSPMKPISVQTDS